MVNLRGELIGLNSAIATPTGSYAGYSFAVPVNLVQKVMRDLIDYGIVQRGFLGVQIADISQEVKEQNDLPSTKGVFVSKVTPDGSADAAQRRGAGFAQRHFEVIQIRFRLFSGALVAPVFHPVRESL